MLLADVPPPTIQQARYATRVMVKETAELLDGTIRIGDCPRAGRKSRVCDTHIDGPAPLHLRVIVSKIKNGYVVRARHP